jgi:hypothetical protein
MFHFKLGSTFLSLLSRYLAQVEKSHTWTTTRKLQKSESDISCTSALLPAFWLWTISSTRLLPHTNDTFHFVYFIPTLALLKFYQQLYCLIFRGFIFFLLITISIQALKLLTDGHAVMVQFITASCNTSHQALPINHFQQTDRTDLFFCRSKRRQVIADCKLFHFKFTKIKKLKKILKIKIIPIWVNSW